MSSCSEMLLSTGRCVPDECCGVLVVDLHAEDVEYEGAALNAEVQWLSGGRRERGLGCTSSANLQDELGEPTRPKCESYNTKLANLQDEVGEPTRGLWRTYKTSLANLQDQVGEPTRPSWQTYKMKLANLQEDFGEPTRRVWRGAVGWRLLRWTSDWGGRRGADSAGAPPCSAASKSGARRRCPLLN